MNWSEHKDLIFSLKKQGLGSRKIAKYFANQGYDIGNIESASSIIRNNLKRWDGDGEHKEALKRNGFTHDNPNWSVAWIKEKGISIMLTNPNQDDVGGKSLEEIRAEFVDELKQYAPKYKKIKRTRPLDPHCLVLDIADLHIGKYASRAETGDGYDSDKAIRFAREGVKGILDKTVGFDFDQIVFVIGNDILHTDTTKRTTTSGTPQDTSGQWHENFILARALYVAIIESLTKLCDVHVVHCPSNHDFMSGFMLADSVYSWFNKNPNVTFDVDMRHRKYYTYGKSLMSFSHGDGAKMNEAPMIMAHEAKKDWAETDYRYIYLHHYHHKQQWKFKAAGDEIGVTVEYLRSPSVTDAWHDRNGYVSAPKAVEGFIHSKTFGQVSRVTHYLK